MAVRGIGAKALSQRGKIEVRQVKPWEEPGLSRAGRVIAFLEDLPITAGKLAGTTMTLRPWQRDFIEAVYAEDVEGRRPVRTAVLSMARKNGKTQLAAGLALCHLMGPELAFTYVKRRREGETVNCRTILFTAVSTPHYYEW